MNKGEFVEAVAARLSQDRKVAAAAVDAVIGTVYAAVAEGERVSITGFGVFEKRERAARVARNPATGAPVDVEQMSVPGFRPGAQFRAVVKGDHGAGPASSSSSATAVRTTTRTARASGPAASPSAAGRALSTSRSPATKTAAAKALSPTAQPAATKQAAKKDAAKKDAAKKESSKKHEAKKDAGKKSGKKKSGKK